MEVGSARWNTTLGGLAVVAVLAGVTFLLPWINEQVPGGLPLHPGTVCQIGAGAVVTPPPGSVLDAGVSRPGRAGGRIVLRIPGQDLDYAFSATGYQGSLDAAAAYVGHWLRIRGSHLVGEPASIVTVDGDAGRQGDYRLAGTATGGVRQIGRYAVVVVPGQILVEAFAVGAPALIEREAATIDATFWSITVGRRS
jgi:hypothetical protein